MKITSYLNFLKNLRPATKNFFLYGSNTDLIAVRRYFLQQKLQQLHEIEFSKRDINDITQASPPQMASLFAAMQPKKIINLFSSNALKAFDQFDSLHHHFNDFLIWQATAVYFQSPLVKAVDRHPQIASIANYQLESGELQFYIDQTLQVDAITYNQNTLQYIIDFHTHDLASLCSNLQNLTLYALHSKSITIDDARNICQSYDSEDIKVCATAFIQGDKLQFLQALTNLNDLPIMVIPLARFITRMLQNLLQTGANYQKSTRQLSLDQITEILNGLLHIEQQIKSTQVMHASVLKSQLCALMSD